MSSGRTGSVSFQQPNSTVGSYDAQNKYVAFRVLKSLIHDLVNAKYDSCKFKLICDDLGLANLIVRGREDLTVVGVVISSGPTSDPPSCLARHLGGFSKTGPLIARGATRMVNRLRSVPGTSNTWRFSYVPWRRKRGKCQGTKRENSPVSSSGRKPPEPCGCTCLFCLASTIIAATPTFGDYLVGKARNGI